MRIHLKEIQMITEFYISSLIKIVAIDKKSLAVKNYLLISQKKHVL